MVGAGLMAQQKKGRGGRTTPPKQAPPPPDTPAGSPSPIPEVLGDVSSVKCYGEQRDIVTQVAALLGLNQQDTMLRYFKTMQDDLVRLMALREEQLQNLPTHPPPA